MKKQHPFAVRAATILFHHDRTKAKHDRREIKFRLLSLVVRHLHFLPTASPMARSDFHTVSCRLYACWKKLKLPSSTRAAGGGDGTCKHKQRKGHSMVGKKIEAVEVNVPWPCTTSPYTLHTAQNRMVKP